MITRRDFLKGLGVLVGSLVALPFMPEKREWVEAEGNPVFMGVDFAWTKNSRKL